MFRFGLWAPTSRRKLCCNEMISARNLRVHAFLWLWHPVFHGTIFAGNEMWSLEQTELQHGTARVTVQSGASLKHEGGDLNVGCGLHDHTRCVRVSAVRVPCMHVAMSIGP